MVSVNKSYLYLTRQLNMSHNNVTSPPPACLAPCGRTAGPGKDETALLVPLVLEAGLALFLLAGVAGAKLRALLVVRGASLVRWIWPRVRVVLLASSALLLLPLLLGVLALLAGALLLYRTLVAAVLRRELLAGADAVWALDADNATAREVINVLLVLEGGMGLEELRQLVVTRVVPTSPKLTAHKKYSRLGYFYWEPQAFDVKCVVRVLEGCSEEEEVSELELQARLAATSNTPLPQDHQAGWEVLLGPRLTGGRTAIIFRVHHSVGDGPSMMRVLLGALVDQRPEDPIKGYIEKMLKRINQTRNSPWSLLKDVTAGMRAQMLPPDPGPLHGPTLSGRKAVAWRGSAALLQATRQVRQSTGASFTGIVLSALASATAEYAETRGLPAGPLTVVVPSRMPDKHLATATLDRLNNAFSFSLVQVPALPAAGTSGQSRVGVAEAVLREASRPVSLVANCWTLRVAGALLPRPAAQVLLHSGQCTAVFSNMPGPAEPVSVGGRQLQQLAFWVPHRGTTGVGASALSYAGRLTLGLAVDEALLARPEDADLLAAAWEKHLLRLAQH